MGSDDTGAPSERRESVHPSIGGASALRHVRLDTGHTLRTWDTGRTRGAGMMARTRIGYELRDPAGAVLFRGEDFGPSPMHADDSDATLRALCCFLFLRPGDADRDYFANYTAAQLAFATSSEADYLACLYSDDPAIAYSAHAGTFVDIDADGEGGGPMNLDFDASDRVSDYVTVPAGIYRCRIAEVRPGTTRAGDERWSVRIVVVDGPHVGKQAAWDSIVFSTRGRARARMVLRALGLPSAGRVTVEPGDLEGREAFVDVRPVEYQSPSGEVVRRNEVPYDGWRDLPAGS